MCKHPINELYVDNGCDLRCHACKEVIDSTLFERQLVARINYLDGFVHGLEERVWAIETQGTP